MIAAILVAHLGAEAAFATRGNFNNDIGVPLTLLLKQLFILVQYMFSVKFQPMLMSILTEWFVILLQRYVIPIQSTVFLRTR